MSLISSEIANAPKIESLKRKELNLQAIRLAGSTIGGIAGLVYAFKGKKGFWGYVGFMLLGSIVIGGTVALATLPASKNILLEQEKLNQLSQQ